MLQTGSDCFVTSLTVQKSQYVITYEVLVSKHCFQSLTGGRQVEAKRPKCVELQISGIWKSRLWGVIDLRGDRMTNALEKKKNKISRISVVQEWSFLRPPILSSLLFSCFPGEFKLSTIHSNLTIHQRTRHFYFLKGDRKTEILPNQHRVDRWQNKAD